MELRNEISRAVGIELPGMLVFDYPTVTAIGQFVARKLIPATVPVAASAMVESSIDR